MSTSSVHIIVSDDDLNNALKWFVKWFVFLSFSLIMLERFWNYVKCIDYGFQYSQEPAKRQLWLLQFTIFNERLLVFIVHQTLSSYSCLCGELTFKKFQNYYTFAYRPSDYLASERFILRSQCYNSYSYATNVCKRILKPIPLWVRQHIAYRWSIVRETGSDSYNYWAQNTGLELLWNTEVSAITEFGRGTLPLSSSVQGLL